jgi:hypothetical protein
MGGQTSSYAERWPCSKLLKVGRLPLPCSFDSASGGYSERPVIGASFGYVSSLGKIVSHFPEGFHLSNVCPFHTTFSIHEHLGHAPSFCDSGFQDPPHILFLGADFAHLNALRCLTSCAHLHHLRCGSGSRSTCTYRVQGTSSNSFSETQKVPQRT